MDQYKKEYRVLIKHLSREYKKRISISRQRYKGGGVMEKFVFDLTVNIIGQKKVTTKTEVCDVVGTFAVYLCGLKTKNHLKKLPLNENEEKFDQKLNDKNYKIVVVKLHDAG